MKLATILQLIVSVLLVVSILLQSRGSGLSGAFGGDFGGYYTKRGLEKFLFYVSMILGFIFIALSVVIVMIANQ
ncbi:MAG: hypothetical protein ACD_8C00073G0002 [uncultured bacterium]|nr:MAG: hypothetical protein ACD_8C00073G0002 [uncultured bacterium]